MTFHSYSWRSRPSLPCSYLLAWSVGLGMRRKILVETGSESPDPSLDIRVESRDHRRHLLASDGLIVSVEVCPYRRPAAGVAQFQLEGDTAHQGADRDLPEIIKASAKDIVAPNVAAP